jgi:hypothetical protein
MKGWGTNFTRRQTTHKFIHGDTGTVRERLFDRDTKRHGPDQAKISIDLGAVRKETQT